MMELENKEGFEKQTQSHPEPIQLLYANVANVGLTLTDIHVTLSVNGRPAVIVAMPLATAKTLSNALKNALVQYQGQTGQEIFDLQELNNKFRQKP